MNTTNKSYEEFASNTPGMDEIVDKIVEVTGVEKSYIKDRISGEDFVRLIGHSSATMGDGPEDLDTGIFALTVVSYQRQGPENGARMAQAWAETIVHIFEGAAMEIAAAIVARVLMEGISGGDDIIE